MQHEQHEQQVSGGVVALRRIFSQACTVRNVPNVCVCVCVCAVFVFFFFGGGGVGGGVEEFL